ncbi:MAG TPA: hypothetical protein VNC50_03635, partial [Planctomycetia bacterium]|nr:hypothetical protein [Planctomycetia bacterium]
MSRALLLPLWLLLCLAFHLSRTLVLLGGIASPEPLVAVDHALHLAQAARGSQFLAAHGSNWGYDPSFLAGYPKTPIHDPSAGLADVALWIAGTGYRPAAYKVMVALLVAAIPPLLWTSFALLGQSRLGLAFAAPLSLLFFWTGFPIALLESGLVSFLFAGAWLPLLLAAFHRWRLRGDFRDWLLLLLVAGPAPFLHPTFLPMAAAPLALAYAATFSFASQRRSWRWHAASWFALALVFLANLFWLLPLYRSWEYRLPAFTFLVGPESDFNFFLRYLAVEPLLAVALALGLLGLPPMLLFSRSRGGGVLALAILWLAAITLFGSAFAPLRALEPLRFHAPLLLLLSAPIAAGLAFLFPARWADAARPATEAPLTPDGPPSSRLLIPRLLLLAAIVFFLAYRFDLFRAAADRSLAEWTDFRPIPAGLPPEATSLLDWLEKSTDRSARILFEDQLRLRERTVPESVHWTPLLPFLVDREFIGGQYQCTPLLHRAAAFG